MFVDIFMSDVGGKGEGDGRRFFTCRTSCLNYNRF